MAVRRGTIYMIQATRHLETLFLPALLAGLLLAGAARAAAPDVDNGEKVYVARCLGCHGDEGDGLGFGADRMLPPPRDFTLGQFKIKTTGFEDPVPNDSDLIRMIRDGMPGTSMPGWAGMISEQDILDVTLYIKTFAEMEEEVPEDQVDYGTQIASSADSIEQGKKLFLDGDRCSECHGEEGKGVSIKKLKGDNGERTWPKNLTKPWTFLASNDPKDIFSRVTVGIPGTQMPSFADPKSKLKLSIEERWNVANYVASLAKTGKVVRPENTVIKATRTEGELPVSPDDPAWETASPSTFFLVPQIIAKDRFFTPANDTITASAFYNDKEFAILLEWDDRTKSIPGDPAAEKIADKVLYEDQVAIQLPVKIPTSMEKPYFGMGDANNPVNIWHWSSGTTDQPESVNLMNAKGFEEIEPRDAAAAGVRAKSSYKDGTWKVVVVRPLATSDPKADLQFEEGRFIPIALANWDGSNSETGSKHTMTTWYWLLLKPPAGNKPFVVAFLVAALIGFGQFWWARNAARDRA